MQVTVDRAAILAALGQAAAVTARKSTIQALTHTILTAVDGRLEIYATDLDRAIELSVPATTDRPGVAMPSTQAMRDAIARLPEGARLELTLDPGAERMRLKSGGSRFNLPSLNPNDLPRLAAPSGSGLFEATLPGAALWRLVSFGAPFMSTDDTRYYLQGIYLHLDEEDGKRKLFGVGCNGSQLAYVSTNAPDDLTAWPGVIVPSPTVPLLAKLANAASTVRITGNETRVRFAFDQGADIPGPVLTTKLVDGTYPDYRAAVPRIDPQARISFDRPALAAAVSRVSPFASNAAGSQTLLIDATGDMAARIAARGTSGEAEDSVALAHQDGAAQVCFNPKYVDQAINAFDGSTLDIALLGPCQPMILTDPGLPGSLIVVAALNVRPETFTHG